MVWGLGAPPTLPLLVRFEFMIWDLGSWFGFWYSHGQSGWGGGWAHHKVPFVSRDQLVANLFRKTRLSAQEPGPHKQAISSEPTCFARPVRRELLRK